MSVSKENPAAGRPLPDEEVAESSVTQLGTSSARLRQRTLLEYSNRLEGGGVNQHRRTKSSADLVVDQFVAIPWGDHVASAEK